MKLFHYTCPGKTDVYIAFDKDEFIEWSIYLVDGDWLLEDTLGYIQDKNTDLDKLLDKWKNVFSL